jgi:hypothetical protein
MKSSFSAIALSGGLFALTLLSGCQTDHGGNLPPSELRDHPGANGSFGEHSSHPGIYTHDGNAGGIRTDNGEISPETPAR